ncbi:MAG TPA: hypothetical protein G4N95_09120, partial [Anaerolineae bacterium]|nr:hypothetical protein [Anaerolineae bacterium]
TAPLSLRGGAADEVISSIESKHIMAFCIPRRKIATHPPMMGWIKLAL